MTQLRRAVPVWLGRCDHPARWLPTDTASDLVELVVVSGRWPKGTVGTVVETDGQAALVEIADDRGRALDFVSLPYDALAVAGRDHT